MDDQIDERQLLKQFVDKKDQAAFELLMQLHGRMVYGVCRRLLRNLHDAEDAFQATFLILARKASAIRHSEHLSHWLYQVARRTSLKARIAEAKRQRREKSMKEIPPLAADSKDLWPEVEPWLDQELSKLPEAYRVPIIICDLEGRTHKEAARQLDIPEGTFSTRLVKAREMLAQRLTQRGIVLSAGSMVVLLSQNCGSAEVPPALLAATSTAVGSSLTGSLAGAVSPNVLLLAKGGLSPLLFKSALVCTLVLGFVAAGVALQGSIKPNFAHSPSRLNVENEIELLGGRLNRNNNFSGHPVSAVNFQPGNQFGDEHVSLLKSFEKLFSLSLNSTSITDASFEELRSLKFLDFLDFSNTKITGSNLQQLEGLKNLKTLALDSTRITDDSLKNLNEIKDLRELRIRSCAITDEGLKNLSNLPMANSLQALMLDSTNVTDDGLAHLAEFKQLRQLSLGGSRITDAGVKHLEQLKGLKVLELNQTEISTTNMKHLFQALPTLDTMMAPDRQLTASGGGTLTRNSSGW